jgi:hypothetical protein
LIDDEVEEGNESDNEDEKQSLTHDSEIDGETLDSESSDSSLSRSPSNKNEELDKNENSFVVDSASDKENCSVDSSENDETKGSNNSSNSDNELVSESDESDKDTSDKDNRKILDEENTDKSNQSNSASHQNPTIKNIHDNQQCDSDIEIIATLEPPRRKLTRLKPANEILESSASTSFKNESQCEPHTNEEIVSISSQTKKEELDDEILNFDCFASSAESTFRLQIFLCCFSVSFIKYAELNSFRLIYY